jgi:hypothetical protein
MLSNVVPDGAPTHAARPIAGESLGQLVGRGVGRRDQGVALDKDYQ